MLTTGTTDSSCVVLWCGTTTKHACLLLMYLSAGKIHNTFATNFPNVIKHNLAYSGGMSPKNIFTIVQFLDLESIFAGATYPKCQMSFPFCWWCLLAWWSESKTFRPSESITQSSELAKVFSCSQAQHRGYQSCQHTTMTTTATSKTCKLESLSFPPSAKM